MSIAEDVLAQHIEIVPGLDGDKARIAGHRIRVQDVAIWHEKLGLTADEIVSAFPTLTLADVYAALAYYFDHREEIEQRIQADRDFAESLRQEQVSCLREKVRTHYGHAGDHSVGQVIRFLLLLHEILSPEEMVGRVEFL